MKFWFIREMEIILGNLNRRFKIEVCYKGEGVWRRSEGCWGVKLGGGLF